MSRPERPSRAVQAGALLAPVALTAAVFAARRMITKGRATEAPKTTAYMPPPLQLGDNHAQVYTDGARLTEDMLAAIAGAQREILFEMFLWKDDEPGERFKQALIERAEAGVEVYIIYDRLASAVYSSPQFKEFPDLPTLHVLPWRSVRELAHVVDLKRFGRDHRKLLIVDGTTGFVGGYNISERWLAWRDTHLQLEGPAAAHLGAAFVYFWNRERSDEPRLPYPEQPWDPCIRVYCNDSVQITFPIRTIYLDAIRRARSQIKITQAYFAPDRHLRKALTRAAMRGVDVQILIPWKSEHVTADLLAQRHFEYLLCHGVKIFAYDGPILHAKTATIDGEWSMIGSCNLDNLSMAFNNEINVEIFDTGMARQLEDVFAHDLRYARPVQIEEWRKRPWHQRARETLAAPAWPFV